MGGPSVLPWAVLPRNVSSALGGAAWGSGGQELALSWEYSGSLWGLAQKAWCGRRELQESQGGRGLPISGGRGLASA